MVNPQALSGHWHEVAGKLREKWDTLSADDVHAFSGNVEQLVSRIQHATGEGRDKIEKFLEQLSTNGAGTAADVRAKVAEVADQAAERAREKLAALRDGYAEAERVVQERPGQTIAVAFGLGMVAGVAAALLLRQRAPEPALSHARTIAENVRKQLQDVWAEMPEALAKRFRG